MVEKKRVTKATKQARTPPGARAAKNRRAPATSGPLRGKVRESRDWRSSTIDQVRRLIREADPEAIEDVKWRKPTNPAGVPVWSHDGMICTAETYKSHVRLTFPKGSAMKDPARLFNASLEGVRRAIHLYEGDSLHQAAFKALIREAVVLNLERKSRG